MSTNWGARFSRLIGKSARRSGSSQRRAHALPRVERLEDRTVPTVLIPIATPRDLVYDQARNILDVTTGNGALQRFSLTSQTPLPTVNVGLNLAGADITADGNTLVVADQGINSAQVLDRVNLQSLQVSSLGFPTYSSSDPSWDLALGTGTKGLFDDSTSSAPIRLQQFDENSGALTFRQDAPGSKGKGLIGPSTLINRSADRSTFLIADTGSTTGTVFTYKTSTDTFSAPVSVGFSLVGATTAVNRNGTLMAVQANGITYILNQNLTVITKLPGMDGGIAFDPTQDLLYAVASGPGTITTYNTNTWTAVNQIPVGETVPRSTPMGNGTMTATTNGWLFLVTPSGVRGYQLSPPAPQVASFALSGAPATSLAGAPFQFTVTALGSNGQTLTNYTGTVHFVITDPRTWLAPPDYTFSPNDQGHHTFAMSFYQAGAESISVVDTQYASAKGSLATPVQVQPNQPAYFGLGYSGSSVYGEAAGYAIPFGVGIYDAFGNITPQYTGTIHFTSSDSAAQLPADYTFTAADKGSHGFYPILNTAGYQSITVQDFATSTLNLTMYNIQVSDVIPGLHFTIASVNGTVSAGSASGYTVTAWDYTNQVATHYLGTVTFASSDVGSGVVLPANYAFTAADAGVHTFSASLTTAGSQTVSVHDTTVTGTVSTNVTVIPAAASTFQLGGFPATMTAGDNDVITVTAYDAYGNIATGYNGTLEFSSSDGQASLPAPGALNNGTGTFAATLFTAGAQSLAVTDSANAALFGTEGGILVSPAAASSLLVTGFPTSAVAGETGVSAVTAYDAYGNVATGYSGTVHISSSDGGASLPADTTLTNGAGTFSATLITAGIQSLTATDTSNAALSGSESNIVVTPAAAAVLVLNVPNITTASVAFTFTVTLEDAYGNVATGYVGTIHFGSSDPLAGLPDDYSFTATDAGSASFTAVFNTAGNQTLTASDDSNGLNSMVGVFVLGS